MKKKVYPTEIAEALLIQTQNLHDLAARVSLIEKQITKMPGSFGKFNPGFKTPKRPSANIILFPGNPNQDTKIFSVMTPFLAKPGRPLPTDVPDFRLLLQRDGLILLAWDKRITEIGERYCAYWVTSTGIPRFYASKPFTTQDFLTARPDHKSYAAEDGIEFYGQEAPVYIVHVAPELMMSNPRHGELRPAHIEELKHLGINVNFDYKFLLTTEKKRVASIHHQAV
ncbi:MAG: hypothetical protein LBH42_04670 [Treponema sp.]|jgi:hypothetical protein|nr:hypothetical protein [Treponema sp.]